MIVLDRWQCDEADNVAILRRAFALKQNREQKRGMDAMSSLELLYYDMLGTRGELAAHLLFRLPWTPYVENDVVRNGDLAGFVEVKAVARPKDRLLIKAERLNEQHAYLLFDGTFHPMWHAIGWIWGEEAKEYKDRFDDQPPIYIIPRKIPPMRPVKELFDLVRSQHETVSGAQNLPDAS